MIKSLRGRNAPSLFMNFKTEPRPYQLEEFEASRDLAGRILPWEMGLGKSKVVLDTAGHLYRSKKIDGVLILAPDGVHRNWAIDEIPAHLPLEDDEYSCFLWSTRRSRTKKFAAELKRFEGARGLQILCVTYSSLMTKRCAETVKRFLKAGDRLYVADESQYVKNPRAKRTIRVLSSSAYAPYRRALSGTPIDNSPFDLYTQLKFVEPSAWAHLGVSGAAAFRALFGVYERRMTRAGGRLREYNELIKYRNLDLLHATLSKYGKRITKAEVLSDLPPKIYSKRYFEMSNNQREAYEELRKEFVTWLENGDSVTAPLAITRILRLQQVTSGYLPSDANGQLYPLDEKNPRLELAAEVMGELDDKVLVWAKYTRDIDELLRVAEELGEEAVRYDGSTNEEERAEAIESFQRGTAKFFVAHPDCAGVGLTLHAAKFELFYNTTFRMGKRLQAEDRPHRIGLKHPLTIIDLVAAGTVDEKILESLRTKRELSDRIYGEEIKSWV